MTTTAPRNASRPSDGPVPYEEVRASFLVRLVMGPMTKVLNPLIRRLAGRRHFFMAGLVHHEGRRSGRQYVTPVGARHRDGTIVIPLTFGNRSDWCRNVMAAGRCRIRTAGIDYDATTPSLVGRSEARPQVRAAFNPMERIAFGLLGIRQFLILSCTPCVVEEGHVR
ncbi:MAG TPA: nitroreductase family deazaflavin-dependent oxidoreductase [Acidimicrobiales bacterium]|nr:nitroreductase family deazaflavin-dependent oxidoreductase [Acidimicrobiales bacterium]